MFKSTFILQIFCLCHALSMVKSNNIIKTTTGPIRGKLKYYEELWYNSYEGIPYAEPPVGDLRFRPPNPITPWKIVLNAFAPGPVCPQAGYFYPRSEMNENCLYLNIYVPVTVSADPLPVVFLVHGGYYTFGSGKPRPIYGPELILQKEIIVVTINYRLGALGFLSFDDIHASGNAGLKDIILASKWVKINIAKFGGNPNLICLQGLGTGAALAHYLLLTEQSSGIFQRAFLVSGSALSYRALQINPKDNAIKLTWQLGLKCNDKHCLKKLKEVDAFELVEAEDYIIRNDPRRGFIFINFFAPVIERPSSISLITRNPLDIMRTDGLIQKIPIITGFNNQEGLEIFSALKNNPSIVDKLNENFELCIPPDIRYPPKSQKRRDLAQSIRQFYFGGGNISIFNTQNYINLVTDTAYAYKIDYWIMLYKSRTVNSPVYYYLFQYDGQLNWGKLLEDITYPGAGRGDELGYAFITNVTENKLQNLNTQSQFLIDGFTSILRNFAISGVPTPPDGVTFQWIEAGSNRNHVVIDDTFVNVCNPPLEERLKFWYREYAKYYEYERAKKGYF